MSLIFSLFIETIKLSIIASITGIFIVGVKKILKNKLSSSWHYYVWLLIAIRLMLPSYILISPVSIYNTIDLNSKIESSNFNTQDKEIKTENNIINIDETKNTEKFDVKHILSLIWASVMFILILYVVFIYVLFRKKLKKVAECRDVEICDILEQCKRRLKIKRKIYILQTKSVKTPCILGFLKPTILLPQHMIKEMSQEDKKYIFMHELIHFKKKDTFINWIFILLDIIHWFNPIIYLYFKKAKEDSEISCDAEVLKYIRPIERKNYGETIINLTKYVSKLDMKPWTSGIVSKSKIKRRIMMISKFKRKTVLGTFLGIIVIALIGGFVLANGNNKKLEASNKNQTKTEEKTANDKTTSNNDVSNVSDENNTDSKNETDNKTTSTSSNNSKENAKNKITTVNNNNSKTKTAESSTSQLKSQNSNKPANSSVKQSSSAVAKNSANSNTTQKVSQEDYTRQEAANAALKYETQGASTNASESGESNGSYANFSSGDIGITVFGSTLSNGKKYYQVKLASKQAQKNGGTGTIDSFYVAKDGSVLSH